jgi:HD-like signal output (HDOD) protein
VLHELNQDEPDLRKICQDINTDPGLAARLLRLANSAQFQMSSKIGSVSVALAVLGLDEVKSLTLAAGLAGVFKKVPGMDMHQFWRCSLDVGKLSRLLARGTGINPSVAFTAGLIHAAGELVMHLGMPEQMRWLNTEAEPFSERRARAEQQLLGYTFAEVGGGFAKSWEFPGIIVNAVKYQLTPFGDGVCDALAGILHLAAWRARAQEAAGDQSLLHDSFPSEVAEALGIDIDEVLMQEPVDWTTAPEAAAMA